MTKTSSRAGTATEPVPALVARGSEALRRDRFKEAVEAFKQVLRQDPQPQWRQALAEAYVGRARGLADKGMLKEAIIVSENTRKPDGSLAAPLFHVVCLIRLGQHQKAVEEVARQRAAGMAMAPAEAGRLADLAAGLSLCAPGKAQGDGDEGAALSGKAAAALQAWSAGEPGEVVERHLAALPLRSAFRPLRLILKALISSADDRGKSTSMLAMVPADGVFAPLARACRLALNDDRQALAADWGSLSAAERRFNAEVNELSDAASNLLDRLAEAERRGPLALFALLIRKPPGLPAADLREACRELLVHLPGQFPAFEKSFGPLTDAEAHRIRALVAEAKQDWHEAELHWCALAAILERNSPDHTGDAETALAQGVIYRHLADLARRTDGLIGETEEDPRIHYLERAVQADPGHLPSMLQLVRHYRDDDRKKDWYQAVDRALKVFPDESQVLAQATDAAVARKSYKSAAGFARRLLAIDPINQPVRQQIIALQIAQARKQVRAARPDLASKTLAGALGWERADMPVAVLRLAQGLAGLRLGEGAAAEAMLREGVRLAGGGVAGWLHAALEATLMDAGPEAGEFCAAGLAEALRAASAREAVLDVIRVIGRADFLENKRQVAPQLARIDPWLRRRARLDWPPAELHRIAQMLQQYSLFETLGAYARQALRHGPQDDMTRFYVIVARVKGDARRLSVQEEDVLWDLIEQPETRQNGHAVREIGQFLAGPARRRKGTARRSGSPDAFDAEEQQMLIEMIVEQLPKMIPGKDIRRMLNEIGRAATIEHIVEFFRTSPAGDVLTPAQIAKMAEDTVNRAFKPAPARR